MPHFAIRMYPGRDDATKRKLAQEMKDTIMGCLGVPEEVVSVSIEDVPKDRWDDTMQDIAPETIFIHNHAQKPKES